MYIMYIPAILATPVGGIISWLAGLCWKRGPAHFAKKFKQQKRAPANKSYH